MIEFTLNEFNCDKKSKLFFLVFLTWQNMWYLLPFVAYILIRIITSFLILLLLLFFFEKTQLVHASHATPSTPPRRFWSPIRIPVKLNLIKSVQFSKTGLEPLPPSPGRQNYPLGPPATTKTFSGSAHEWEAGVRLWYAWFSVCMDIQKCGKRLVF